MTIKKLDEYIIDHEEKKARQEAQAKEFRELFNYFKQKGSFKRGRDIINSRKKQ